MALTVDYAKLYEYIFTGMESVFFDSIADDVDYTVMGTHLLTGVYNSKVGFLKHAFEHLARILK